MACGMDEAGLLNSMTAEQLVITCLRLQRSCNDMAMLLSEFEQEQAMLRRERDRLHKKVDKVTAQIESGKNLKNIKKDRGIIWNLIGDSVDIQLVSHLFREKEERKAAKRRKWSSSIGPQSKSDVIYEEEECGPFSDANVQMSWGCDLSLGVLRQTLPKGSDQDNFDRWIGELLCIESVAEAEPLPDSAEWQAQLAVAAAAGAYHSSAAAMDKENQTLWSPRAIHTPRRGEPPWSYQKEPSGSPSQSQPSSSPKVLGHEGAWHAAERDGGARLAPFGDNVLEAQIASALGIVKQKVTDPPAAATFSRPGAIVGWIADALTNSGAGPGAEPATSAQQEAARGAAAPCREVVEVYMVMLQRESEGDKWGLSWRGPGFKANKERVVEKLMPGSVAEAWNLQRERAAQTDRCIQPGDRLVRANGKASVEEITDELKGREVTLEFQRVVYVREAEPQVQPPRPPADGATTTRATPRPPSFGAAFSAYLEKSGVAPPPQPTAADRPGVDVDPRRSAVGPRERGAGGGGASGTDQGPAAETQDDALVAESAVPAVEHVPTDAGPLADPVVDEPRPPRDTPYALVVQVLSMASGMVRLSWLFDWEILPEELRQLEGALRGFEVLQDTDAADDPEDQVKVPCARPVQTLNLRPGRRYSFRVRAVLRRGDGAGAEDTAAGELWGSAPSAPVLADLRDPKSMAQGRAGEAAAAEPAPPARPKCGAVASRFSSFLAQQPTGVAGAAQGKASVVMGGSAERVDPLDPLGRSKPRTVTGRAVDPEAEKRDISERLRVRRGLSGLDDKPPERSVGWNRQRSFSVDSDEDSLLKLSSALMSLEKTATAHRGLPSESAEQERRSAEPADVDS